MISETERAAIGAADHHAATLTLPNAIIIGAGRSMTTSLHRCLGTHPNIFAVARKEVDYFCRDEAGRLPPWFPPSADALVPRTIEDYAALFDAGASHAIRLESSVSYLWAPVARRIAEAIPDCKLIAILRHPVDQARSWAEVHLGHPPTTNELQLLLAYENGIDGAIPLARHGQYHRDLEAYFRHFPSQQIFVRTFEALTAKPGDVIGNLQRWLGLEWYTLDMPHLNRSGANLGIPGGAKAWAKRVLPERAVGWAARLLHKAQQVKAPPPRDDLPDWFRDEMMEAWYPDVAPGLERLGVDVSAWKR